MNYGLRLVSTPYTNNQLTKSFSETLPDSHAVLVSGMSLINVIVNSPDELRVRVVLRNELFALGLDGIMTSLSSISAVNSDKLSSQVQTFTYLYEDGIPTLLCCFSLRS